MQPLVDVRHLSLALPGGSDRALAVSDISFTATKGKILCLVGESGSGKSVCAQAIMGLLPPSIRPAGGEILFDGQDILKLLPTELRALRGRRMAMIFQEPMTALNPVMRIGDQIAEAFEAHALLTPAERKARAVALAREVDLPDPERIVAAYPHEISGGQRQRAMIAMALALEPDLLVADEPTTALDVTTQAEILRLVRNLQQRRGMCVLLITHDFGVVREMADDVVVLQKGAIVEAGETATILTAPRHPYTQALLAAMPSLTPPSRTRDDAAPVVCAVSNLSKTYAASGGLFASKRTVHAVKDVSFAIRRGETLGLVGESGSGKSTIARLMTRLVEADGGSVEIGGADILALRGASLRTARRRVQMIFQDPFSSLNPRRRIGACLVDGPLAQGVPRAEANRRASELLALVGLDARAADRFPHEFSGGQRQRIGIARALAMEPDLIVADEPVSALDVSIQKQVLDLLAELKKRLSIAMLFITHDLNVAAQVCDRIAVMHRGEIVEIDAASRILGEPRHPYTQRLLASLPGRSFMNQTIE